MSTMATAIVTAAGASASVSILTWVEGVTSLLTALASVLAAAGVIVMRIRRRRRRSTRPRKPGANATSAERTRYVDQLEQYARDKDGEDDNRWV